MNLNFTEERQITGHLQITKVPKNGPEEILFDDHNIIVSGMGVGLSHLYSLSGGDAITDFHLDRFQVGVSADGITEASSIYKLGGPLGDGTNGGGTGYAEYGGAAGGIRISKNDQQTAGTVTDDQYFGLIPFSHVARVNDTSVRYTIVLDEDSCNGITRQSVARPLNEIGLFMKNPDGTTAIRSLLVAYRQFSDITKASDFALVFRWTINF